MLCSSPTAKSGSTWLDRLRSSKGIPTGDGLDLDSFLLTNSHSPQTRPIKSTRTRPPDTRRHDPPSMTAVLAELFNMGAALTQTQISKKKCPRKQTNPKFFLAASSPTSAAVITSAAANYIGAADLADIAEEEEEPLDRGEEEEEDEFKGFTRSDVTMIDTSLPGWKVDRLVFRKKNVWKVRVRKQKSKLSAKKKKKTTKGTLLALGIGNNGIGSSKDNAVNIRVEKPVKTHKEVASSQKEVSGKIKKGKTSLPS